MSKANDKAAQKLIANSNTLVIKVGSALIRPEGYDGCNNIWLKTLAEDIIQLKSFGKNVVLVSSGAIALACEDEDTKKLSIAQKQSFASIGQPKLIKSYEEAFGDELTVAQHLLSRADLATTERRDNFRAVISEQFNSPIIPIINENDSVATEEIKFGDNDQLSVQVATALDADLTIILSRNGFYTADPHKDNKAKHVLSVKKHELEKYRSSATSEGSSLGTGGMKSKFESVSSALEANIPAIISDGRRKNPILSNLRTPTIFVP